MKKLLYFAAGLFISISYAQNIGDLTKTSCFLEDCSIMKSAPNTEFGYITVPENYNDPASRNLQIAYVILKTENPDFEGDPVLIFQGGWGLPMTDIANAYLRMPLLKDRDIILYDYRGTGFSTRLPCRDLGKDSWIDLMDNLTADQFYKKQTERYAACITTMEQEGIDFNEYGMNNITRDAAFLAQQLPYDTYNLFGVSYGTMAIQHFIRAADLYDITLRTAILDSSVPIGIPTQGTMSTYYKLSLLHVLKDCEDDAACNEKFPDLRVRFIAFMRTLNEKPFRVTMEDGKQAYINKEEMNAILHQMIYDRRIYATLPLLLESIMARDAEVLLKILPQMQEKVETSYNATGLVEYVYDHKASTDVSRENLQKNKNDVMGYEVVDSYLNYYYEDTRIKLDSIANTPIHSKVPALLLSGAYDPVTPPKWTKSLQNNFSNSFYFDLDKVGHGAAYHPCGTKLMSQFIKNPTSSPDAPCVEELTRTVIPFTTDYHKNSKIRFLGEDVLQFKNIAAVVLTAFTGIILLINILIGVFRYFKKNSTSVSKWRGLASFFGILTMGSAMYLVAETASTNAYLLLFGLPDNANWAFIASIVFMIAAVVYLLKLLKAKRFSIWNVVSLLSFITLTVGIIIYKLYPSFA
tara:strand:- start:65821 stop:67728 length:1908 start_codon:yes stop_codon:yes gene_type:complete